MKLNLKIIIATLLSITIIIASLLYISNALKNESRIATCISVEENWSVGRMDEIIKTCDNTAIKELPLSSFSKLSRFVGSRGIVLNLNSIGVTAYWLNTVAKMPIENIQKNDDNHIVAIYCVSEENIGKSLALVVFQRIILNNNGSEAESWEKTGELYFIDRVNDFDDFSDIEIGSSIEDLYTIDNSIHYDVLRLERPIGEIMKDDITNDHENNSSENTAMIYKLLKSGIMTIEYDVAKMTVLEITKYQYGELPSSCISIDNANVVNAIESSYAK